MERFEPCENWWSFYLLWLKVAVTASLSVADLVGFVVGLLIPLAHSMFPQMQESMLAPLVWKIPLGVFCCVGAVRLLQAPYLIYRDRYASAKRKEMMLNQTIAEREQTIKEQADVVSDLKQPKRSAAEQRDLEKIKKALERFKEYGLVALRYIRDQRSLTFGAPGSPYVPTLPANLPLDKAVWVYRDCAVEGILSCARNLGNTVETFTIPDHMSKALDESLFSDEKSKH